MNKGDYVLISANYLRQTENFTTRGGKKKWYRVQVGKVNENSFEFTSDEMNYIHEIEFSQKHLYNELKEKNNEQRFRRIKENKKL